MAVSEENTGRGLLQVFTGNGKGKTTAALGTILRAAGHDFHIFIVFFIKGTGARGEYESLARLPNVTVARFGLPSLIDPANLKPEEFRQAGLALGAAREAVRGGGYDLVVLDEVNVAVKYGLVKLEDIIELIEEKPEKQELILTGRYADKRLIEMADLVTEMVSVKHPYDKGINAREGIEY